MGLFSRKDKQTVQDFCKNFYEQWIFAPDIAGTNPWKVMCETIYQKIADLDSTFNQVDSFSFSSELRSTRLEVFAVALSHRINERLALEQSKFTKQYLEERQDGDIWESMLNYNQAISRAVVGGHRPGSGAERAAIAFTNSMRASLFDEWLKLGYDPEVVARVANRISSLKAWKSGRGNTYLAFELGKHINADNMNEEARLALINIIHGFYMGALEEAKKVKIV